ncbi:MAG TPA: DNA gyrase inhibitor YacG [Gammaproteobacteria bacterium]|nr:DNA gyrase inhibitor YacG [Gammaproteobacteria bacterium]
MIVRCPQCNKIIDYSDKNEYRPFCSERCRLIDLGEWMTEKNRIPSDESSGHPDMNSSTDIKH